MGARPLVLGALPHYPIPFRPTVAVAGASLVVAFIVAVQARLAHRPVASPTSRALAIGSAAVIVVATGSPYHWPFHWDGFGRFVPKFGRGGLSEWRELYQDPRGVAALLLVSNVLFYVPLAFFAALGWRRRGPSIVVSCLLLSLSMETLQYFVLNRTAALDDVLLNLSGSLIGILFGVWVRRRFGTRAKS